MTLFPSYCRSQGLPTPEPEYRFGAIASGGTGKGLRERLKATGLSDWRFDWAWPEHRVALEVEGGIHGYTDKQGNRRNGAHGSVTGILRDIAKYNAAGSLGWIVLRCQPKDLMKLETLTAVRSAMKNRAA